MEKQMTVEIKIARYELYPTDEPTSFCVGFQVSVNSRSMYQDTQVSLENAKDKTEDEIVLKTIIPSRKATKKYLGEKR